MLYATILLNLTGALEVIVPLLMFYFLYRYRKYYISSIVCGLAVYFVISYVLVGNIFTIIRMAAGELYFLEHPVIGVLIDAVLTALVLSPLWVLMIRNIRRGRWSIFDAMAMAGGYWVLPQLLDGAMHISTASIVQHALRGTLADIATEDYTMELLESMVASVTESGPFMLTLERICGMISQLLILVILVDLALSCYYVVKRNKKHMVWALMGAHLAILLIINGASSLLSEWLSLIPILILGAGAIYFLIRFLRFYRTQQAELIRRRKEFKEEQHRKYQLELEEKKRKQSEQ